MANPHWRKGESGNPNGRPVGSKNRETIAKEERRAIFDAEVSKMFLDKIKEAKPEYLLDQFLGKAGEKLDITTLGDKVGSLAPEVIALAEEELRKRKIDGE